MPARNPKKAVAFGEWPIEFRLFDDWSFDDEIVERQQAHDAIRAGS